MHFPWKARGPATFGLDSWRLSVSNELVHNCTWSLKPWSCSLHSTHDTSVYQAEAAEHTRSVSNKATVSKHAKADMPGSLMDAHAKKNKVKKCKILQHVTVIMAAHHHAWISNKRPTESGTLGRRYLNELPIKVCKFDIRFEKLALSLKGVARGRGPCPVAPCRTPTTGYTL